jgi:acylphosphatase
MPTWELLVHGKVQGVGFRWLVQRIANQYEVHGYVRNLCDGTVQILAQAEEHTFEVFQLAIASGGNYARVDKLELTKIDSAKKYHGFEIK